LEHEKLFGVLCINDVKRKTLKKVVVWPLYLSPIELVNNLNQINEGLDRTTNEEYRRYLGRSLYGDLFPDDPQNPKGIDARRTFQDFVKEKIRGRVAFDSNNTPSIFIRFLSSSISAPILIPIGLMNLDLEGEEKLFVGYYFRIENPLPFQIYKAYTPCLSKWFMLLPKGGDSALKSAYDRLSECQRILPESTAGDYSFRLSDGSTIKGTYTNFDNFARWITDKRTINTPAMVSLLSHHDTGMIYFNYTKPLRSSNIGLVFNEPSAVILNGCSTGKPGSSGFIKSFNRRGVQAVIATNVGVSGHMAGDFIDCLAKVAEVNLSSNISISDAYFRALACLNKRKFPDTGNNYGSRVLWYSFLGNSNLQICKPKD
jgi:hypothetical protein